MTPADNSSLILRSRTKRDDAKSAVGQSVRRVCGGEFRDSVADAPTKLQVRERSR